MQIKPLRSYRCTYHPKDGFGAPVVSETGLLPFVQLKAANAEQAQRLAHHITGCAVADAVRIDGMDAQTTPAANEPTPARSPFTTLPAGVRRASDLLQREAA